MSENEQKMLIVFYFSGGGREREKQRNMEEITDRQIRTDF